MNVKLALGSGAVLLLVFLTYLPALAGPFQFDDYGVIVQNPQVHGLAAWWQSMPGIRPLLKLSYALNRSLSPDPFGFHLFNVVLHALNALLVWAVAAQWLRRLAPRSRQPLLCAGAVALLFALHPAATEAVTYVSGRSVSLMAFFYLAAMWLHFQAWRGATAWSAFAFALALGVRETAVTLPVALWLLCWLAGENPRVALYRLRWHGLVLLAAGCAALVLPGYDRFLQHSLDTRGPGEQVLGQMRAHAHLFLHSLVGLRTNLDPDLRTPGAWDLGAIATAMTLAATLALAWCGRRRWPWLSFGLAWYLLQLAPGNSLLPRFDLANDRHLYLAVPGVALVLVVALQSLRHQLNARVALAAMVLVLAAASHLRNLNYLDEVSLWTATVRASPDKARPWSNLGWARQAQGDLAGARLAYECALAIQPDHRRALVNLSLLPDPSPAEILPGPPCRQARLTLKGRSSP